MVEKKTELYIFIFYLVILILFCLAFSYFVLENVATCTRDPLKFTADKISTEKNLTYAKIYFELYMDKDDIVPFSRREIVIEDDGSVTINDDKIIIKNKGE